MTAARASQLLTRITAVPFIGIVVAGLLSRLGEADYPVTLFDFVLLAIVFAWIWGPFLLAEAIARAHRERPGAWVFPIASVGSFVGAIGLYVRQFYFSEPDAQAPLIFFFVPVYQYALVLLVFLLASFISLIARR